MKTNLNFKTDNVNNDKKNNRLSLMNDKRRNTISQDKLTTQQNNDKKGNKNNYQNNDCDYEDKSEKDISKNNEEVQSHQI